MLFNRNKKPKLDPKVRFQHRQFTTKLDKARQFKREPRVVPETQIDKVLSKVYLGTRWAQIGVGLLLLGMLYLIYIPNFLSLQTIEIKGVSPEDQRIIEARIRQAISEVPFYNPQHNILFLEEGLVKSAASAQRTVYEVASVTKSFEHKKIIVEVIPKHERYLLKDAERVYSLFNDGSLREVTNLTVEQWLEKKESRLIKIQAEGKLIVEDDNHILTSQFIEEIEETHKAMAGLTGSVLAYFNVRGVVVQTIITTTPSEAGLEQEPLEVVSEIKTPINPDELIVQMEMGTQKGKYFKVIFDAKNDLSDAVNRLSLLLSQTTPERYNNINYIDMRIEKRGYICLVNTPCAN